MNDKLFGILFVVFIIGLVVAFAFPVMMGTYPFGPEQTLNVTINRLYIDTSSDGDGGRQSHYMVGTDKGVYEVDNSWIAGIWNADEIYSSLQQGSNYTITVKGNKYVNFFMQQYPYIIKVNK